MSSLLSKFRKSQDSVDRLAVEQRGQLLENIEQDDVSWFWQTDEKGRLVYLSEPALQTTGLAPESVMNKRLTDFLHSENEGAGGADSRSLKFRLASRSAMANMQVRLKQGRRDLCWEMAGSPKMDETGNFLGYHGTIRDITETVEERRSVERMSQFDSLTGLANRHRMSRQLEQQLSEFRQSKRSCALMMLDLDRFKQVNDTLGHPAGDELLRQVAARLKTIFDHRGEIGRLGGDEFQIIAPDIEDRGELGELAKRLVQLISQPYSIAGSRAIIGCSIGLAVAPFDGVEADELVKAADLALYSAKERGRGNYRFYTSELSNSVEFRHMIEADLRDAVVQGQMRVYYQPIVDAKTHQARCMEALLRWEHPERGFISPADFIPVAEEVGIMTQLGEWVLEEVCTQIANSPLNVRAAVNVSPVQFASSDFAATVSRIVEKTGVDPSQIELEITESVFVGDMERAVALFHKLKEIGVRLALDDFGTGYSSLSYLRNAPFDKIKIDQSFVRGCSNKDGNNAALIGAIVSMAQALGLETVAEGVEAQDELATVVAQGANMIQGRIFSDAISSDIMFERLSSGEVTFVPRGPEKFRHGRRTEFRKIGLIHGDDRYNVFLRNLSKTGAKVEGVLGVPEGTDVVLDLGGGQLAVATVRRSVEHTLGLEFETQLVNDGGDGLCTRHRVSPYQIEAAGRPLTAISDAAVAALTGSLNTEPKAFIEVDMSAANSPSRL